MSHFFLVSLRIFDSAVKIYNNPRGTSFTSRGGKPHTGRPEQQQHHHHSDRPLPPSYVCYRCGQKGLRVFDFAAMKIYI
jgi:protein MPE1